jgi:hypothetical protein
MACEGRRFETATGHVCRGVECMVRSYPFLGFLDLFLISLDFSGRRFQWEIWTCVYALFPRDYISDEHITTAGRSSSESAEHLPKSKVARSDRVG